MFGILKSYDEEYLELYEYLTQDWKMKSEYSKAFLNTYKKSIGKILAQGKRRMSMLENSSDPEARIIGFANLGEETTFALVGQAYYAYMGDLRRGKHVGTPVELAIWAILSNRSDLVQTIDRAFGEYIQEKHEERFPNLYEEVFHRDDESV